MPLRRIYSVYSQLFDSAKLTAADLLNCKLTVLNYITF